MTVAEEHRDVAVGVGRHDVELAVAIHVAERDADFDRLALCQTHQNRRPGCRDEPAMAVIHQHGGVDADAGEEVERIEDVVSGDHVERADLDRRARDCCGTAIRHQFTSLRLRDTGRLTADTGLDARAVA
jgi:hypothetical protein